MTIKELMKFAEKYRMTNDDAQEVLQFATHQDVIDIKRGVCGLCANRNTETCPFPNQCKLSMPICLTFKKKE